MYMYDHYHLTDSVYAICIRREIGRIVETLIDIRLSVFNPENLSTWRAANTKSDMKRVDLGKPQIKVLFLVARPLKKKNFSAASLAQLL